MTLTTYQYATVLDRQSRVVRYYAYNVHTVSHTWDCTVFSPLEANSNAHKVYRIILNNLSCFISLREAMDSDEHQQPATASPPTAVSAFKSQPIAQ